MVQVRYTRNLFLRGICIVYLFAFLSFYIQIPGLYGDNGILPARSQVDLKSNKIPLLSKLKHKHTWLWFAPYVGLNVEYMLDVLALIGIVFSFLGFVSQRFCIAPIFAGLWSLYYSLYQIGQTFMMFQWDVLLLEVGFLCTIIAPFWYSHRGKTSTPSDGVTFWSVRWLLFRLMFSSGVVKLTSGCPTWWSLDALSIYFESQCIPTPLAWYAHHLPNWFLRLNTAAANIIELVVPFLFFFPNRKVRIAAFYIQIFLQLGIILTGNYNFFNFLTICLCISLLDDQFFKKKSKNMSSAMSYVSAGICFLVCSVILFGFYFYYSFKLTDKWTIDLEIAFTKEQFARALDSAIPVSSCIGLTSLVITIINALIESFSISKGAQKKFINTFITAFYAVLVIFIFELSLKPHAELNPSYNPNISMRSKEISNKIEHLHVVNSYGLFRRMTGVNGRPEVTIEGSNNLDGPWKEYEFLYKPGNINNSLPFVAPHQPRLDWQMWFAALGTYRENPWLYSLTYRLLTGQPEVLALMNQVGNPFHNKPPKYIKASLYHYHYTPWTYSGQSWWRRERIQEYFPVFSRDDQSLIEYLTKMKVIQDKPIPKVTNTWLKLTLDSLRSAVGKLEASLFLWGVFTAGWVIILTAYNNVSPKKK